MQIHITFDEKTDAATLARLSAMLATFNGAGSTTNTVTLESTKSNVEDIAKHFKVEAPETKPPAGFGNDPLPEAAAGGAADANTSGSVQQELPGTSTSTAKDMPVAERDSTGLVWDERIHSGSKSINKDGSWRNRKNLDPLFITQTEQQLRAMDQGQVVEKPSVVPKPPTQQGNQLTFGAIVKQWQTLISEGVMTQDDGNALLQLQGVNLLPELMKRPDLWAGFVASLPKLPE